MNWQPIETAPRDVDVWAYNGEQQRMRWIEGEGYALWVHSDVLLSDVDPNPDQPTNWMPLPEPPSSASPELLAALAADESNHINLLANERRCIEMSRIQPTRRLRMPRAAKSAVPSEHSEAVQLMHLVRLHENKHPELRWLFAVPNGGHRNKVAAGKLKAEGVKSGVPDYLLPLVQSKSVCGVGYIGLALELKRTKRGQTSAEQRDWLNHFDDQGWRAVVCQGHAHAWAVICEYLSIPNCLERTA